MILLCVDGIDPGLVLEYGWGDLFLFNYSLKIPKECYVPDVELGSTPHTTRVWPTIFSGEIIDYGLIKREGARKKVHDLLVKSGITWRRKKKQYTVNPSNENLDTIFDHYDSFHWNIPTISPEWIATFPSYEAFVQYCEREYLMWQQMTYSEKGNLDFEAYYMRYLDYAGHNDWKRLKIHYANVFTFIHDVKSIRDDVIVLSDHGCKNGVHTERAYLGSDLMIDADWVHELRAEFETLLDGPL